MVSASRRRASASLSVFLGCVVLQACYSALYSSFRKETVALISHPAKTSSGQWNILDKRLRKKGCTANEVVGLIASATGLEATDYHCHAFDSIDDMIVCCPTWNTDADEYRSGTTWDDPTWDDHFDELKEMKESNCLRGKTVAVLGCGDSKGHTFCDGIEDLHNAFEAAGAKMVGYVDASEYDFQSSKSVRNGKFLGLPLDQENEADKSESRVVTWIEQLKAKGMPLDDFVLMMFDIVTRSRISINIMSRKRMPRSL